MEKQKPLFRPLAVVLPQIVLQADREAAVEGCRGIVEYTTEYIHLLAKDMELKFYGQNLCILSFQGENAIITGKFQRIEYLPK